MRKSFLFSIALLHNAVYASNFMPFDHDILCVSKNDFSSVKVVYDKKEYPDYGWQGGIHWEINTGVNSQLINFLKMYNIPDGSRSTIKKADAAGTITNWIQQDKNDPIIMRSMINGQFYEVTKNNKNIGRISEWMSVFRISKVTEKGFSTGDLEHIVKDQTYYLFQLDWGSANVRYELDECKTLN